MKIPQKVKIAEVGLTKNVHAESGLPYFFTDEFIQNLASFMAEHEVRARKTHLGRDLLEGLIGGFSAPIVENGAVYADLELLDNVSEAVEMAEIIKQKPQFVNSSIMGLFDGEADAEAGVYKVNGLSALYSIDIVGIGAATSSFFNNQIENQNMGLFGSAFAFLTKNAKKFAAETVTDIDGKEITIEKVGEVIAIGDAVMIGGEPATDGSYEFLEGDEKYRLIVAGGVIENIEKVEEEQAVEPESTAPSETFAAEIKSLKNQISSFGAEIASLKTQLAEATKFSAAPSEPNKAPSGKTEGISAERRNEIKNKFRK